MGLYKMVLLQTEVNVLQPVALEDVLRLVLVLVVNVIALNPYVRDMLRIELARPFGVNRDGTVLFRQFLFLWLPGSAILFRLDRLQLAAQLFVFAQQRLMLQAQIAVPPAHLDKRQPAEQQESR